MLAPGRPERRTRPDGQTYTQLSTYNCIPLPSTRAHTTWTSSRAASTAPGGVLARTLSRFRPRGLTPLGLYPMLPRLHPGSSRSHLLRCSRARTWPAVATGDCRKMAKPASRKRRRGNRCPVSAEKEEKDTRGQGEEVEKQRQGCKIRSTFETSEYNVCNIRLKVDETNKISI